MFCAIERHGRSLSSWKTKPTRGGHETLPSAGFSREARRISAAKEARIKAVKDEKRVSRYSRWTPSTRSVEQAKIAIREDGLYYLTSSEVSRVLAIPEPTVNEMIGNGQLSLSNQGQKVPYLVDNGNSAIYFYGEGIDSIYTRDNIYWLEKTSGLLMENVDGSGPSPSAGGETYAESAHFEEGRFAGTGIASDPSADYWFWDFVCAGDPDLEKKVFPLKASGVAVTPEAASLTVRLQGATSSETGADHHAVFHLNGTPIGETQWTGASNHEVTLSFSQGLLKEGNNDLTVTGHLDSGVPYSIFYIDFFDLTYQRYYRAENGALLCRGDENDVVTITGFGTSDLLLFDVTRPDTPKQVRAVTIDKIVEGYRISFTPSSPETVYLAVARGSVSSVKLLADTPSSLKKKENRADYLIITTAELKEAAQSLASYRQNPGFKTMVVLLEDIMDEFNFGIFNPEAIREFLSYAYLQWHEAPAYVVLAGDGTYDYKDYLGYGDNLIPPLMVITPFGIFPSDNRLGDIDDDHVPEIVVGRLPVATAQELTDLVHKIIAYERAESGDWRNRVILLADDPDDGGNFTLASNALASLLPGKYVTQKIYLADHPIDDATELLLKGINNGAFLLNYFGHGDLAALADEGVFTKEDVLLLNNGDRLPVVTAMTCIAGHFGFPGFDSLAEDALLRSGGGAAAVWAFTGMSLNAEARKMAESFFRRVSQGRTEVLGKAVLKALQDYGRDGGMGFMLDINNLLGDPALRLESIRRRHGF